MAANPGENPIPRKKAGRPREVNGPTRLALLEAAQALLRQDGFAHFSTRKVAAAAGVQMSQIHYHFGSKEGLVLALLEHLDQRLLARQNEMFASEMPLSRRWDQACDFLDQDVASGYVRLLQECIAQGWSNSVIAEHVRTLLYRWKALLTDVAGEAEARFGGLGPFSAAEVAALVGTVFVGAEAEILLGFDEDRVPVRTALRKVGLLIEMMEKAKGDGS